ncbi:unnamed protein product [Linum tenue]|uniref:Uncharacterized protein n=1 Tax=Linum tenue TaxID=586396 RepID=A0AAV0KN56_9ROSI|nr:unnamed protein product [Linum tenue]
MRSGDEQLGPMPGLPDRKWAGHPGMLQRGEEPQRCRPDHT